MGTKHVRDSTIVDKEAGRMEALRRLGISDPADLTRFDVIARTAALALGVSSAGIALGVTSDRWTLGAHGMEVTSIAFDPASGEPCGPTPKLVVVEDCRNDARFANAGSAHGSADIGFYACCPLIGLDQKVMGYFCVMDADARRFDQRSDDLLRGFAVCAQGELNALERGRRRLESINGRLVAPAVHRMRGALTSIHGFSNFLLNQTCAPEQRQEFLGIINDQAGYLASVVTELVDLVHMDIFWGRDFQFALQPVEDIVREAIAAYGGGTVNLHIEQGLPPISVDADQLRRALLRLFGYATAHSPPGGGIDVGVARADESGYLAIMATHRYSEPLRLEVDRVFEPFSRPTEQELHAASNIGLALTKEIVGLHGGKAFVKEDRDRHRMEVSLLLPIRT